MTIKLGENLIEVEDECEPGPTLDTVVVKIKEGQNWGGNTFNGCKLQIPRFLFKDAAVRA
jgi:ribosomal protein L19